VGGHSAHPIAVILIHANTAERMLFEEILNSHVPKAFAIGRLYKDGNVQREMIDNDNPEARDIAFAEVYWCHRHLRDWSQLGAQCGADLFEARADSMQNAVNAEIRHEAAPYGILSVKEEQPKITSG
jgi:hypothetical protein